MAKDSGITRTTSIPQANIFGRIGTSIGKGLAEQVPKEIERSRLASGLQQFEKDIPNLSPTAQIARLASIPGMTPQVLQTVGELARYQNQGNAYGKGETSGIPDSPGGNNPPDIKGMQFANLRGNNPNQGKQMPPAGTVDNRQRTPNVGTEEYGQPQVVAENPLDPKYQSRLPWTPEQRNARVATYRDQGFLVDQAKELAADDENRYRQEPETYKENLENLQSRQKQARDALTRHLETKLQKKNDEVFSDISGPMLVNLQRGMERDLRTKPNASVEDVANDWSNRALDLAKTKKIVETLGTTTGIENLLKGNETYGKLKAAQDIFKRAGNLDEFYELLGNEDFGMSPQGRASIAYPLSQNQKKHFNGISGSPKIPQPANVRYDLGRKAAIDVEEAGIGPDDSLLTIARELSMKDPFFDQVAFFEQLEEDKNQIGLNERQRREIIEGKPGMLPYWGDIKYLNWGK